jgi:NDP-sugar pyrophosphorylase family protein
VTSGQQSGARPLSAVVLAAGRGTRLGKRTEDRPKCLVEVNGTPILVNALERLVAAGVRETIIVVGYRSRDVRDRAGDHAASMQIRYRENTDFSSTNTTRSLSIGLDGFPEAGDVLVIEGDVFFEQRVLDGLMRVHEPEVTLVERWQSDLDGSVVTIAPDGSVTAWLHKKDRPSGASLDGTFKTVNIHRFTHAFVRRWLQPALASHVKTDGGREPIESVFADLVRNGVRIYGADVCGLWVEIDDESDLRAAEKRFPGASHGSR